MYVVLLRGINVGKAKRVPMADLRVILAELGCTQVTTLLNSGNAVVVAPGTTTRALAESVAEALRVKFGFEVAVVVKSGEELKGIIEGNDLAGAATDPSRLLVAFGQDGAALASLHPLEALVVPPESFLLNGNAAYLHCANGILASKAAEALLGKLGRAITTRNWATVLKLHALAQDSAT